ncbi:glycerate kinase [Nocardioides insulae]|uniref:glycerate kinase n=1 Tax=Nocardioides insulae TaxID=394734 RepID=UPI0004136DF5|nr:glycerate kinase [Nocardioides insulae]
MTRHLVIAPDSFKGSCSSPDVAAALARGWRRGAPQWRITELPLADGGEGTAAALVAALDGTMVTEQVDGPLGEPLPAHYGLLPHLGDDGPPTAVIEMAAAAGLDLVDPTPRSAGRASTYGVGQLVRAALERGARRIVLTLGGSATTDGGVGMAQALGASFTDHSGAELDRGGAALAGLRTIDLSGLDERLRGCEVLAACDVDNPLSGPSGAAAVFGPQKGADGPTVEILDLGLRRLGETLAEHGEDHRDRPGAGAAGGLGFGALVFLGARLTGGFDLVADAVGLDAVLRDADLVLTGEGALDVQSMGGKAPVGVLRRAQHFGVPVIALAGSVAEGSRPAVEAGMTAVLSVVPGPGTLAEAVSGVEQNLERTAEQVARLWSAADGGRG